MSRPAFALTYGPWALVAGGSEGLGGAFAEELARRGVSLVLVARRPEPLAQTAARLRATWPVEVVTVAADLAAAGAIGQVADAAAGLPVGLVVMNAAHAPAGPFLAAGEPDIAAAVHLNCGAAALLAHQFLPAMVERGKGGVIFMSSLAGLQGVPNLAVYGASKAFLISLAEALWAETRAAGVDVLACCAGAVITPGYQQAASRPAPGSLSPAQVAATALDALGHGFRVVPGRLNRVNTFVLEHLLPKRAAISVFGRATAAALNSPGGQA
ncbi:MAG TPA: short-chain dehydrogenase [Actinobacteria bacterium]|nr:short-chain dehydrogenase [Actinomycetota bacterium]